MIVLCAAQSIPQFCKPLFLNFSHVRVKETISVVLNYLPERAAAAAAKLGVAWQIGASGYNG